MAQMLSGLSISRMLYVPTEPEWLFSTQYSNHGRAGGWLLLTSMLTPKGLVPIVGRGVRSTNASGNASLRRETPIGLDRESMKGVILSSCYTVHRRLGEV